MLLKIVAWETIIKMYNKLGKDSYQYNNGSQWLEMWTKNIKYGNC